MNTRGLVLQGNFTARVMKGKGVRIVVDGSPANATKKYTVTTATGTVVGAGKLDERGDLAVLLAKKAAKAVKAGDSLRLYDGTTLLAATNAS